MENTKQLSYYELVELEMRSMNCTCLYGECPDVHVLCPICNVGFRSTCGRDFHQYTDCSLFGHDCFRPGPCFCLEEAMLKWEEERKKSRPDEARLFRCRQDPASCDETFETQQEKDFHITHVCYSADFCCVENCDCFKKLVEFLNSDR